DLHRAPSPHDNVVPETPPGPLAREDESARDEERQNDEASGDESGRVEKHALGHWSRDRRREMQARQDRGRGGSTSGHGLGPTQSITRPARLSSSTIVTT